MKTYVERFITEVSIVDLDLEFPHYSDTEKDEDGDAVGNEVLIPHDHLGFVDSGVPSITIDEVVKILNGLKDKGADRVYISDHCDHHGYYFYGVKLEEETPDEYRLRMEKEKERLTKTAKESRYKHYLKLKEEFEPIMMRQLNKLGYT